MMGLEEVEPEVLHLILEYVSSGTPELPAESQPAEAYLTIHLGERYKSCYGLSIFGSGEQTYEPSNRDCPVSSQDFRAR